MLVSEINCVSFSAHMYFYGGLLTDEGQLWYLFQTLTDVKLNFLLHSQVFLDAILYWLL